MAVIITGNQSKTESWSVTMLSKRDAIDDGAPNPRGQSNATLAIVFACISFVFVSLRMSARLLISKAAGPDDFLICGSMVSREPLIVSELRVRL